MDDILDEPPASEELQKCGWQRLDRTSFWGTMITPTFIQYGPHIHSLLLTGIINIRIRSELVLLDLRKYHKSSLLRVMFCSDCVRKSKGRLDRVRAYTIDFLKRSTEDSADAFQPLWY
jgi:hypothetical protein